MVKVDLNRLLMSAAILGSGKSGLSLKKLVKVLGGNAMILDEKGQGDAQELREEDLKQLSVVLYSPGFSQDHRWLRAARAEGIPCYGELDFASFFFNREIIGITGTNGKSTLVHLLTESLKKVGKNAFMCGNIGIPLSECLLGPAQEIITKFHSEDSLCHYDLDTIAVCEISSFQAEDLNFLKLDALLWPQFDEDHLDRHGTLENYFKTKWNLVERLRTERFVCGETVERYARQFGFTLPKHSKLMRPVKSGNDTERLKGSVFSFEPQSENFLIAKGYWELMGYDLEALYELAREFKGLEHRLQVVDRIGDVCFWNDSKGTNFSAVIAALKNFDNKVVWIGGGKNKGGDIKNFVHAIGSKIEMGLLIGETSEALEAYFKEMNIHTKRCHSLEEAVQEGFEYSSKKKNVEGHIVLSPGFSSYDMFENYEHRGKCFKKAILQLKSSV